MLAERGKLQLRLHRLHLSPSLFQSAKTLWTRARANSSPRSGLCCCQIALCAQTRRASPWPSVNPRCVHPTVLPAEIVLSWLLKHTSPPPQHTWGPLKQRSGVLPSSPLPSPLSLSPVSKAEVLNRLTFLFTIKTRRELVTPQSRLHSNYSCSSPKPDILAGLVVTGWDKG